MNYWAAVGPTSFSLILNNAELLLKHRGRVRRLGTPRLGSNSQAQRPAARRNFKNLTAVVLLFLICCAAACSHNQRADSSEAQAAPSSPTPIPSDASPQRSSDSRLSLVLDPLLDRSDFAVARWGVAVMSLRDGKVIYERNGAKLFTPASNMKVYTTAVAIDLLGADYRWRTSVYSGAEPDASGTVRGDLVLYGRGAPDLVSTNRKENSNSLEELAQALFQRGVRRVQGNVIGDESYFRGEEIGEGWQWNDLQWYFGAEASALSINGNEVDVNVVPPRGSEKQPTILSNDVDGYVHISNNIAVAKRGERFTVGVQRGLSDNDVRIWGNFTSGSRGFGVRLSVHRPSLWAAKLFLRALKLQGISVEGQASTRDWRVPETERFKPESGKELAFVVSKPLSEIIRVTNKESVNLNAELILRTLGRERHAVLSAPEPAGRERGDEEVGVDIVRFWLDRAGVATSTIAIHDGSGLSRLDLVTPESTAQLLSAISGTASGQVFRESLPIAGTDGTLQGRMKTLAGRVVAKTGTLTYDNSLSGYVTATNGELLVFSIMCNDSVGHRGNTTLIDELVTRLAEYPASPNQAQKPTNTQDKQ